MATPGVTRIALLDDQLVRVGTTGPWLVREVDSGVGYYTRRYLAEEDITAPRLMVASNAVIVALLRAGFGQSLVSQRAASGVHYTDLGERYQRKFYLLQRENDADEFKSAVLNWAHRQK